MAENEEREEGGLLRRFFAKIGDGVTRTGEVTKKSSSRVTRGFERESSTEEEDAELSDRLEELKRLGTDTTKKSEEEEWEEEEEEWDEEREELDRPTSERLAEAFYKPLSSPASKLASSLGGLEEELYMADMNVSVEKFAALMIGVSLLAGVGGLIVGYFFLNMFFAIIIGVVGAMLGMFMTRRQPKLKIQNRKDDANQSLPYVLRHISTQLASGIGMAEAMNSVARGDYGVLSEEFEHTLQDMRTGASMVDALDNLSERVGSESLNRAIRQIQRAMRTGGNLADTLGNLADEAAYELRMELRDYTQSLGMMTMIYMFMSSVIPPMLIVLFIVMKFIGGTEISAVLFAVIYLLAIPFLLIYLVMIFKNMEPGA